MGSMWIILLTIRQSVNACEYETHEMQLLQPMLVERCPTDGCDNDSESDDSEGEGWKVKDQPACWTFAIAVIDGLWCGCYWLQFGY